MRKWISVIIPIYNEETCIHKNLFVIYAKLKEFEEDLDLRFTLICVDDGSRDATAFIVREFCYLLPDAELICLTRNFGKEGAMEAGLARAAQLGVDAAIVMDSDLQHPPELIPQMVANWRKGDDIVEAVKADRGREPWLYKIMARLFYRLFEQLSGIDLRNQSDYKLLDAKVIDTYLRLEEKTRFFRGLIRWMGFPMSQISFIVPKREGGSSRWPLFRLVKFSVNALTSFTSLPLHLVTFLGLLTFAISIVMGVYSLALKLLGHATSGFTTVIILLLFIGSVLMCSLGIIGLYLSQLYNEIKSRPNYLINERGSLLSDVGKDLARKQSSSVS